MHEPTTPTILESNDFLKINEQTIILKFNEGLDIVEQMKTQESKASLKFFWEFIEGWFINVGQIILSSKPLPKLGVLTK